MNILERLFLKKFLAAFLLGMLFFLGVVLLVELFELREDFDLSMQSLRYLGEFLLMRIPFLCYLTAPVSLFLSALFVTALLALSSETTAVRAGGIGLIRWTRPVLLLTTVIALAALVGSEYVVAASAARADLIRRVEIQKLAPQRAESVDLVVSYGGNYLAALRYSPSEGTLEDATLIVPNASHDAPARMRHWRRLVLVEDRWRSTAESEAADLDLIPPPAILEYQAARSAVQLLKERSIETVRISELIAEIRGLKGLMASGRGFPGLENEIRMRLVRLQAKIAFPVTLPLLVLLGILLGARVGRRHGFGSAVANAVVGAVGYMILLQLSLRFGEMAARLDSMAAAAVFFPWITPVVLSGLILRFRSG